MKAYWGDRYSSTHSLTSAVDGGEWSASRPGRFAPRERTIGTHWIGGWVGPQSRSGRPIQNELLKLRNLSDILVELLGRGIGPPQGLHLHRVANRDKRGHIFTPRAGFHIIHSHLVNSTLYAAHCRQNVAEHDLLSNYKGFPSHKPCIVNVIFKKCTFVIQQQNVCNSTRSPCFLGLHFTNNISKPICRNVYTLSSYRSSYS
jgi:hypothetical protein